MAKQTPKLVITGTSAKIPVLAQCSICRGRTAFHADQNSVEANTKALQEQFRDHVSKVHGEDFSQAAARIVREATKD